MKGIGAPLSTLDHYDVICLFSYRVLIKLLYIYCEKAKNIDFLSLFVVQYIYIFKFGICFYTFFILLAETKSVVLNKTCGNFLNIKRTTRKKMCVKNHFKVGRPKRL